MDRHAPQKTPTFQVTTDNIVPVYISPDCTDCVAPVDHHVGARLKQVMGLFYHTVTHDLVYASRRLGDYRFRNVLLGRW